MSTTNSQEQTTQKEDPTLTGQQQDDNTVTQEGNTKNTFTGKRKGKNQEEPDFKQNNLNLGGSNIADFLINEVMSGNIFIELHQQISDKLKLIPCLNGNDNFKKLKTCMNNFLKGYTDEDGNYHSGLKDDFHDLNDALNPKDMARSWKEAFKEGLGSKGLETDNGKDDPKKEKAKEEPKKEKKPPKKEKPKEKPKDKPKEKKKPEDLKKQTEAFNKNEQAKSNNAKNGKRKANLKKPLTQALSGYNKLKNRIKNLSKPNRSRDNSNNRQISQTHKQSRSGRG